MTEEWKAIPGYEGIYDVSSLGRVRSYRAPRQSDVLPEPQAILGGRPNRAGYPIATLTDRYGKSRAHKIHRLVLLAFVGSNPPGLTHVRHLDGDKLNSRLENLAYGTPAENVADQVKHGVRYSAKGLRRTHCLRGHELTPENTYIPPSGRRECRTCKASKATGGPTRTHCKEGHPFAGDNLHIDPRGRRVCRACRRTRNRKSAQRTQEAAA